MNEQNLKSLKEAEYLEKIRATAQKECEVAPFELKYKPLYILANIGLAMGSLISFITFVGGITLAFAASMSFTGSIYVAGGIAVAVGVLVEVCKQWSAKTIAASGGAMAWGVAIVMECISFGGSVYGAAALVDATNTVKVFDASKFEAERAARRALAEDYKKSRTYRGVLANADLKAYNALVGDAQGVDAMEAAARAEHQAAAASASDKNQSFKIASIVLTILMEVLIFASAFVRRWYINAVNLLDPNKKQHQPIAQPTTIMTTTTNHTSGTSTSGTTSGGPAPLDSANIQRLKKLYVSTRHNMMGAKNESTRDENRKQLDIIAEELRKAGSDIPKLRQASTQQEIQQQLDIIAEELRQQHKKGIGF